MAIVVFVSRTTSVVTMGLVNLLRENAQTVVLPMMTASLRRSAEKIQAIASMYCLKENFANVIGNVPLVPVATMVIAIFARTTSTVIRMAFVTRTPVSVSPVVPLMASAPRRRFVHHQKANALAPSPKAAIATGIGNVLLEVATAICRARLLSVAKILVC